MLCWRVWRRLERQEREECYKECPAPSVLYIHMPPPPRQGCRQHVLIGGGCHKPVIHQPARLGRVLAGRVCYDGLVTSGVSVMHGVCFEQLGGTQRGLVIPCDHALLLSCGMYKGMQSQYP